MKGVKGGRKERTRCNPRGSIAVEGGGGRRPCRGRQGAPSHFEAGTEVGVGGVVGKHGLEAGNLHFDRLGRGGG